MSVPRRWVGHCSVIIVLNDTMQFNDNHFTNQFTKLYYASIQNANINIYLEKMANIKNYFFLKYNTKYKIDFVEN